MRPRNRPEDRIRSMIRSRRVQPSPQRQRFDTDIDMPGVTVGEMPPPRAAIESGEPSPMELRSPPPKPKPSRPPVRMDAPPPGRRRG